jgi:hypothetical protein
MNHTPASRTLLQFRITTRSRRVVIVPRFTLGSGRTVPMEWIVHSLRTPATQSSLLPQNS